VVVSAIDHFRDQSSSKPATRLAIAVEREPLWPKADRGLSRGDRDHENREYHAGMLTDSPKQSASET
jgi:hypothetical protein